MGARLNGKKMWLKAIALFKTETPVAIYHLLNSGHQRTITVELAQILTQARDAEEEVKSAYEWGGKDIPVFGLRLNVPKIPGQDTSVFYSWPKRIQWHRKTLHLECDVKDSKMMQDLVAVTKRRNLIFPVWGKNVRLTNTSFKDTKPQELTNMGQYVHRHVNYHSSMIYDGLVGVVDLNQEVAFYAESDPTRLMGYMSLRYVLYKFMKLSDGHSLIGEIHQENNLASVDIVIANAP